MAYDQIDEQLYSAASDGDIERARVALLKGADINKKNTDWVHNGWTPLMAACDNGRSHVVEFLLSKGANPHMTDYWERTALHYSSQKTIIQSLLERKVSIDREDKNGWTPLHWVAYNGYTKCVQVLLSKGAKTSITNEDGKTALDLAICQGQTEVVSILKEHTALVKDTLHLMTQGMENSYVLLTNKKIVLYGPPCVGKTAFKDLLFNKPPPIHHHSTPIASRPVQAIERMSADPMMEGKIWDEVTEDYLFHTLSDAILDIKQPTVTTHDTVSSQTYTDSVLSTTDLLPLSSTIDQSITVGSSFPLSLEQQLRVTTTNTLTTNTATITKTTTAAAANTTRNADYYSKEILEYLLSPRESHSQELHKATWIHLIDSGGQPQFADMLRIFLRGNALHVIVIKVTENLLDKPTFTYSLNGQVLNTPSELQMTNLQIIEHYVRSVSSSKHIFTIGGKKIICKPGFMIVATHCDQQSWFWKFVGWEESLKKKNYELTSCLNEYLDFFLFYDHSSNDLIFPVDNLCQKNREKISSSIRERIMLHSDTSFSVPIPVRYYMFEIKLKEESSKESHGMISLDTCHTVGTKLGMGQSDVSECLGFMDTMGTCYYYPKLLPRVIFTNVQFLLDTLSNIVRVSFVDDIHAILPRGLSRDEAQQALKRDGVFNQSLLNELELTFIPSLFTKDDLILLLQHLLVIAPIIAPHPKPCQYFMPIVLPVKGMTRKERDNLHTLMEPLLITFNSKVVLKGLFPTLVVSLLSRHEEPTFFIDSRSPTFPNQLRHAVKLFSENLFGSVILFDDYNSMDVYFTGLPKYCPVLRQVILQALESSSLLLEYDSEKIQFTAVTYCHRKHATHIADTTPHPVSISLREDPPVIRCSKETDLPCLELTDDRRKCWFNEPEPNDVPVLYMLPKGKLSEKDVPSILAAVKEINTWEVLGIHLKVKFAQIEEMKVNNHYQIQTCRKDLIMTWLQTGTATGHELVSALDAMGRNDIIQKLSIIGDSSFNAPIPNNILPKNGMLSEEHGPLLLKILHSLVDWEYVGTVLGLSYHKIQQIKIENPHSIDTCRMLMIITWLTGGTANCTVLIEALKTVNRNDLVFEIEKR